MFREEPDDAALPSNSGPDHLRELQVLPSSSAHPKESPAACTTHELASLAADVSIDGPPAVAASELSLGVSELGAGTDSTGEFIYGGFSYDAESGYWFNSAEGYFYDAERQLFADSITGQFYKYQDGTYVAA